MVTVQQAPSHSCSRDEPWIDGFAYRLVWFRGFPDSFAETIRGVKMTAMAKKTGMSDSSLWVLAVVLIAVAAWMYFK